MIPIEATRTTGKVVTVKFDDGIEAVFEPYLEIHYRERVAGLQRFSLRNKEGGTVVRYDCQLHKPGQLVEAGEGWTPVRIVDYWEAARDFVAHLCWGEGGLELDKQPNMRWWYHWRVTSVGLSGIDDLSLQAISQEEAKENNTRSESDAEVDYRPFMFDNPIRYPTCDNCGDTCGEVRQCPVCSKAFCFVCHRELDKHVEKCKKGEVKREEK